MHLGGRHGRRSGRRLHSDPPRRLGQNPCSIRARDQNASSIGQEKFPRRPVIELQVRSCKQLWTGWGASSRAVASSSWVSGSPSWWSRSRSSRCRESISPRAASRSLARSRPSSPSSIKKFPGVEAEKLVFVFDNTKGDKAKTDAAITKAVDATKGVEGVAGGPGVRAGRARQLGQADRPDGAQGHRLGRPDGRRRGRDPQERRHPRGRRRGVPDPPRRPAGPVGRHAGPLEGGPREGRGHRLPDRLHRAAADLRLRRRGAAAAQPRLHRRGHHRRDRLLPRAGDPDVDLRDQHLVDARHRRRGRLLVVRARRATGRRSRQARPRTRRARSRCGPPASPWPSPASP